MAKHGKADERELLRSKVDKMLKQQAKEKPGGASHGELIRRDIERSKGNR